jgi:DNA repair protein RadC
LTVIIRADLAYDFTKVFLKEFENSTREHFADLQALKNSDITYLTACAGIAYIKDSYPFHYGVHLAEELTKKAKKESKSQKALKGKIIPPSSLAFYKVQSSFTEDFKEMVKRTHYIKGKNRFFAGPYFIKETNGYRTISELDNQLQKIQGISNDKSKGISKLRQWISELYKNESKAEMMMDRIKEVNNYLYKLLNLENERNVEPSILLDLIDIHTFNYIYKSK